MTRSRMLPVAILSGGLATRLRPLTETIPKALVELAEEPFIAHQLRLLRTRGIEQVVICAGYLGEMIRDFVGDGSRYGLHVDFSFDGETLLGTGGAIKKAIPLLGKSFFVLYGDSYLLCNFRAVQQAFEETGRQAMMTVFRNSGRWDTSNVELSGNTILAYDKRNRTSRMQHIDYGLGVLHAAAFDSIPPLMPYDLADFYQLLLQKGQLGAFEVEDRFYEAGSFAGLEELRGLLESGIPPDSQADMG